MNRTERRAAMRLTQQQPASVAAEQIPAPTPAVPQISEIQLAANRANALQSTGPKTEAGRAASSQNAMKTGLTSRRTILLSTEDAAEYQAFVDAHLKQFTPEGLIELDLVQAIADNAWRIRRISTLEHATFAAGRIAFAEQFKDKDVALLDLHTTQAYEKSFRNLRLQENRLSSRRDKDLAELYNLQAQRRAKEEAALAEVAAIYVDAKETGVPFTPTPDENGFVFSTQQIERFLATRPASEAPNRPTSSAKNHRQAHAA